MGAFTCWNISVYTTLGVETKGGWSSIRRVGDHNGDVVGIPDPGESDVELAVGEDRRGQIEGNFLEGGAGRTGNLYRYACPLGRCSC
jgi:hypothetical protein